MAKKINDTPLTSFQQKWCETNYFLLKRCCDSLYKKFQDYLEYEDVVSCAHEGLVKASRTFDAEKGVPFTHIYSWVKSEVYRFVKKSDEVRLPEYLHPVRGKIRNYIFECEGKYNRYPSKEEVIKYLVDNDINRERALNVYHALKTNEYVEIDNDINQNEIYSNDAPETPETLCFKKQSLEFIASSPYINERDRLIIAKRLHGYTLEEIGSEMNVCRERIRQIQNSAMTIIKEHNGN